MDGPNRKQTGNRDIRLDRRRSSRSKQTVEAAEEAVARIQGRYADDIAAYDQIHVQILGMADMLANGIVAQFPNRFSR